MRALQKAGLGGLVVPIAAGGHGHGLEAVARVCEVLGSECASTSIAFGMHLVGSAVLAARANEDQIQRYLEPIARGEHLTAVALSEPGTGASFYLPEARLARANRGNGFRLNGRKSFVTSGGHADSFVMSAITPDHQPRPGELSCVIVDAESEGLTWGPPWAGWGMRGVSAREAYLKDVDIPRTQLIGREGDEIWYIFEVIVPYFLAAMAGTYVGIANAALKCTRRHLLSRSHSHDALPLAQNVVVQHRFATLWAGVQRSHALLMAAACMRDAGDEAGLPTLLSAKAEVADTCERVVAESMTLLGGRGYSQSHPIHRHYRDLRASHVMSPTTDLLRIWTGRSLLGFPLLTE